ncbi:MAG: hypothetical protein KJO64_05655 [Bacteroidia bacterium]|nr:hypothetical protein [Bacteroidia bacterium]
MIISATAVNAQCNGKTSKVKASTETTVNTSTNTEAENSSEEIISTSKVKTKCCAGLKEGIGENCCKNSKKECTKEEKAKCAKSKKCTKAEKKKCLKQKDTKMSSLSKTRKCTATLVEPSKVMLAD